MRRILTVAFMALAATVAAGQSADAQTFTGVYTVSGGTGIGVDVEAPVAGVLSLAGGLSFSDHQDGAAAFVGSGPRLRFGGPRASVFGHVLFGAGYVRGIEGTYSQGMRMTRGGGLSVGLFGGWHAQIGADYSGGNRTIAVGIGLTR